VHELSLAIGLLRLVDQTARTEGASRVLRLVVELGALSCVEPEALDFCFEAVRRGSVAEGAELVLRTRPGRACCRSCGSEVTLEALGTPCTACGSYALEILGGDELRLIELEVDECA